MSFSELVTVSVVVVFLAVALVVLIMLAIRNELVYRIALRRIYWSDSKESLMAFQNGPSHTKMMFDFRKWTATDFYPEMKQQ